MKMIEIKNGAKTTYKLVSDDYNPENDTPEDLVQGDITTTCRHSVSMMDIPKKRWDMIFGKREPRNSKEQD